MADRMNLVEEIQTLWMKLVGFDPSKIDPDGTDRHHGFHLTGIMEPLRRAQHLDPSNGLFLMRLDAALDQWLHGLTTDGYSYLEAPAQFDDRIAMARRLRDMLSRSGMPEHRDGLRATVMRALEHYGAADREDVEALLSKKHAIGELWRDALEAMDQSLDVHQFLRGKAETQKPLYHERVLGFWSINDALRLAAGMESGIAMALIRDTEAIHSYFAFVIRNGGNLWVVTDRTNRTHPMQARMSRRPDKELSARMGRSRFPYELLNLQYLQDEEGDVVGINVPRQEGIIPAQQRAFRLKPIREIAADEVSWTAIMFALLTRRFFHEVKQIPHLSYTGEMVELPHLIESIAASRNLPMTADAYAPIQGVEFKATEMTTDRIAQEAGIRQPSTRRNEWMLERYNDRVRDDVLAITAVPAEGDLQLGKDGDLRRARPRPSYLAETGTVIREIDATAFGSAEQILADRAWIARYNQASQIKALAEQEFAERETEIRAWWTETLRRRTPAILDFVRNGSLVVTPDALSWGPRFQNVPAKPHDILRRQSLMGPQRDPEVAAGAIETFSSSDYDYRPDRIEGPRSTPSLRRCALSDRPATDVAVLVPEYVDDLMAIAGMEKDELPEVLRHWRREGVYAGNHILDRLDPMEFVPRNPWQAIKFQVFVYVSKHEFPRFPHVGGTSQ